MTIDDDDEKEFSIDVEAVLTTMIKNIDKHAKVRGATPGWPPSCHPFLSTAVVKNILEEELALALVELARQDPNPKPKKKRSKKKLK
jgi:hypothetical protein